MSEGKSVDKNPVASFLTVYNNLPLAERHQVILVLESEPITWEVARNEIVNKAKREKKILEKLVELGII